ncbi:MAG: hypothetical protein M3340_08060, partial [Actinomycetota bacterium]|nr:hypothetical protein [Actinomycetota bacterium]
DSSGNLYGGVERGPVVRYLPDGARDREFGHEGLMRIFGGTSVESLLALGDGGLLVGGGNERQGRAPEGFAFGPAVMRLGASGAAYAGVRSFHQPAACFLRVRNPTLTHLLRRGRTARFGKLLVGAYLRSPTTRRATLSATARAGGRTFPLGNTSFRQTHAGSSAFEIRTRSDAYRLLQRARQARITVTLSLNDPDATTDATVTTTLRR